jgi:hypothetical protein
MSAPLKYGKIPVSTVHFSSTSFGTVHDKPEEISMELLIHTGSNADPDLWLFAGSGIFHHPSQIPMQPDKLYLFSNSLPIFLIILTKNR